MSNASVKNILNTAVVMPVMVIEHLDDAVPLAKALLAGGIRVLEITLRSEVALQAIEKIIAQVPDAIVGAGTVTSVAQLQQVEALGVQFALSPGLTPITFPQWPPPVRSCSVSNMTMNISNYFLPKYWGAKRCLKH